MSGENILKVVSGLIDEVDIEKICIEYWQRPEKEDVGGCLIKISVEKEWV